MPFLSRNSRQFRLACLNTRTECFFSFVRGLRKIFPLSTVRDKFKLFNMIGAIRTNRNPLVMLMFKILNHIAFITQQLISNRWMTLNCHSFSL